MRRAPCRRPRGLGRIRQAFLSAFDQDVEIVSRPRRNATIDAPKRGKIVFKPKAG
jgi:hypothetical protein